MKFIFKSCLIVLLYSAFSYCMDPSVQPTQDQKTEPVLKASSHNTVLPAGMESLPNQLNQLSLNQNSEPLLITKEQVDKTRLDFIAYVKRTKKYIKNPMASFGIKLATKVFEMKKKPKKDAIEGVPASFLGVKGAEPDDIHFLNAFLETKNKQRRENALKEFGNSEDLKSIHAILKTVQDLNSDQVEEQRIMILHKHVVIYLGEKEGTTKKELRDKVKKGDIKEDIYFKATAMSLFGAFVLEDKLPKKNDKN